MGKRFFTKRIKILLTVALVVALAVTLTAAFGRGQSVGRNVVSTILSPLRSAVAAFDRGAERVYGYIFRYESVLAENETLRRQLAEQENDLLTAESYKRENQRLRELLKLSQEHMDYSFAAAYVTSWSSSPWESSVTVDKGADRGLTAGMCAVTGSGQVVGLITEVGANWAKITTIYDPSSQISASLASSGETGVVQGGRDEAGEPALQMRYLSTNVTLKNGDGVVTTGSERYPRGLVLGTVSGAGLDESGIAKYARLSAPFRAEDLEQVFLITEYAGT